MAGAADSIAIIAPAHAPARFEIFSLIGKYPHSLSSATAATRMGVVAGDDSFATAAFYKWILMQHLKGFNRGAKHSCAAQNTVRIVTTTQH
jgi:hypothetical protein